MVNVEDFTIGWVCALTTEFVAAQCFLDEVYDGPDDLDPSDSNDYKLGRIGRHHVVVAVLPNGTYGTASAAIVAKDMIRTFTNIRVNLMVGIAGGAPDGTTQDIRLGDVVVSIPGHGQGGVFQYDFGKSIQNKEFLTTGYLNQPPTSLQTAVNGLSADYEIHGHRLEEFIDAVLKKYPRLLAKYGRPDPTTDRLYASAFEHSNTCPCLQVENDGAEHLITRVPRTSGEEIQVHYGLVASANQLMKDATIRDKLAREKGVLCFEMEAAGLMNNFPCLVIRGICDYSDTHKNKAWQGFAAMTAAAFAKSLLHRVKPSTVAGEKKATEVMEQGKQTRSLPVDGFRTRLTISLLQFSTLSSRPKAASRISPFECGHMKIGEFLIGSAN